MRETPFPMCFKGPQCWNTLESLPEPLRQLPIGRTQLPTWASGFDVSALLFSILASPGFSWRIKDCSLNPSFPASPRCSARQPPNQTQSPKCSLKSACWVTDSTARGLRTPLAPFLHVCSPLRGQTVPSLPPCPLMSPRTTGEALATAPSTHFFVPQRLNQCFLGGS